jgi:hypothetical protein
MLIFVFLVTDEHEELFHNLVHRTYKVFVYLLYGKPVQSHKRDFKERKVFPVVFQEERFESVFFGERHFRGGHLAIEGRRKVHF